ncbi:MAG: hypothetical protein GY805_36075, partial [Chloroflexi bacterium]|nr:hypothetical protein [Chloroflexota bacterium]
MTTEILQARALSTETFADLDQLQPGERFELTWAFRNDGQTAWQDVAFVYSDESFPDTTDYPHSNFAAQTQFNLTELGAGETVAPDDTVYLTVQMVAPETAGIYLTGWQLQTAVGQRFGPVCEMRLIVVQPSAKALEGLAYLVEDFHNSVAEYNNMAGERPFVCTWKLKNSGIYAWSGDFKIVTAAAAVDGTRDAKFHLMGAAATSTLRDLSGQDVVPPDGTVTLKISFTAPATPGIYAFHWQLTDVMERPFGGVRWMRIVVKQGDGGGGAPSHPVESGEYRYGGTAVTFFTGIHGPADDWMWGDGQFQNMMQRLNMPVFFMSPGSNGDNAHFGDKTKNAVRLYWNPRPVSADEAYNEVRNDQLRPWWNRDYRRFVFFNEPQFGKAIAKIEEGMGISWHNKEQFASFLAQILRRARQDFPGIQLFTTPMCSNAAFDPWGWRASMWAQVHDLVGGWCLHAYSGDNVNAEASAQNIVDQIVELQRRFKLQIPIIVSESSVNRGN